MSVLLLLFAALCACMAGLGISAFFLPSRTVSRIEWAGLALILGSGFVSLALFVLSWTLRGGFLVAAVAVVCGALGAVGAARWRRVAPTRLPGEGWFVAALAVMLFVVGWQAGNHALTADGLFNFEIRGQLAALHGGRVPTAFFSDASRTWMHPSYPLFLPLNQAWIYLCLGGPNQGWVQLLSLQFVAGAACLLFSGVARLTGEAWRGGLAVGMLFFLPAAMTSRGGAVSLWADFPVAVVFLGAVIYLIEFAATGSCLPLLSVLLALLPWVKREGLVLAGVLTLALAWAAWRRGDLRRIPVAILPLTLVVLGWKMFLHFVNASGDKDFLPVSPSVALEHADRLPFVIVVLGRELIAWDRWSLLWPLTLVAVIRIARAPELARWRLLAPVIATLLVIFTGIYIFSAWPRIVLHVATSLPRLLLSVAMPALLTIVVAFPRWDGGKAHPETLPPDCGKGA